MKWSGFGLAGIAVLAVLVRDVTQPWTGMNNTNREWLVGTVLVALLGGMLLALPWKVFTGVAMGVAQVAYSLIVQPAEESLILLGMLAGAALWTCVSLVGWALRAAWDRWIGVGAAS